MLHVFFPVRCSVIIIIIIIHFVYLYLKKPDNVFCVVDMAIITIHQHNTVFKIQKAVSAYL